METVTVERSIDAPREAVADAVDDVEAFFLAAGFDEVTVAGEELHLSNRVGVATIELTLERVEAPDAALAFEQREGPFESMRTVYRLDETAAGTRVEATTDFAVDVAVVGQLLDATVIRRQRRRELVAQLDSLATAVGDAAAGP